MASHGFRNFLLFIVFIGGGSYLGAGYIAKTAGNENWNNWAKKYSLIEWPKLIADYSNGEYDAYCRNLNAFQSSAKAIVSCNSSASTQINGIEKKVASGEISLEEGSRMVCQIGDIYLGRGKSEKIMNIISQEDISPQEAARRVINEVPTGLPDNVDKGVKKAATTVFNHIEKNLGENNQNSKGSGNQDKGLVNKYIEEYVKRLEKAKR